MQQLHQSSGRLTNINASLHSTDTHADTEGILQVVHSVRGSLLGYTIIAAVSAALVLSGFENGRKFLQRIFWFLDGLLGGAPHTVTLPGPSGLPLVGSLFHVSFS